MAKSGHTTHWYNLTSTYSMFYLFKKKDSFLLHLSSKIKKICVLTKKCNNMTVRGKESRSNVMTVL